MGSDIFFHGLEEGETCEVKVDEGKFYVIKMVEIREVDKEGNMDIVFELNGNRRVVKIKDESIKAPQNGTQKVLANKDKKGEIGSNIPGTVIKILVDKGDDVEENAPIAVIEAMKMETNILSPLSGKIVDINVKVGQQVEAGELIASVEQV
jgi:pyruvate carboxylase